MNARIALSLAATITVAGALFLTQSKASAQPPTSPTDPGQQAPYVAHASVTYNDPYTADGACSVSIIADTSGVTWQPNGGSGGGATLSVDAYQGQYVSFTKALVGRVTNNGCSEETGVHVTTTVGVSGFAGVPYAASSSIAVFGNSKSDATGPDGHGGRRDAYQDSAVDTWVVTSDIDPFSSKDFSGSCEVTADGT